MTSRRNNRKSFDEETLEGLKAEYERSRRLSAGREEKEEVVSRASSTTSSSVVSDLSSMSSDYGVMDTPDSKNLENFMAIEHTSIREPDNFALVVPGIYRSSYPQTEHHEYLKTLGLKTIITLVSKEFPDGFESFMQENGIRHVLINVEATKRADIPDATLHAILNVALDTASHPVLIHCNHGKHRTGCVVAVIRHWQSWPCARILSEYKKFAEPKARPADLDYITNFDISSLSTLKVAATNARDVTSVAISEFVANGLGEGKNGAVGKTGRRRINQKSIRLFILVVAILAIWTMTVTCWQK